MKRVVLDVPSIEALFARRGYAVDRIAHDTFRSRFTAGDRVLPLLFRVDPSGYIQLAVVPYLNSPASPERARVLYDRLLTLNHTLLMAKLSIDDDLDVVLSVEYPTRELDESEVFDALDTLSFYANRHHAELEALAHGPETAV